MSDAADASAVVKTEKKKDVKKEDSDSDDDIPLANLTKKSPAVKKEEPKDDDSSDDDIPLAQLKKQAASCPPRRQASMKKTPAPAPAPAPKKRKAATPAKKTAAAKKKKPTPAPKKAAPKKKAPAKRAPAKKKVDSKAQAKASAITNPIHGMIDSKKGELCSSLLLRWWYVIDYPSEEDNTGVPSSDYYELEGIPGVSVGVIGDNIGKVVDNSGENKPSLRNFFTNFSCEDLKQKLLEAYDAQIAELLEHEKGTDACQKLEAVLKKEKKSFEKFNCAKADKAADKIKTQFSL